jgi:hypothetical protein
MNESNGCTNRAAQIGKGLSILEWEALEYESISEVILQVLKTGRNDAFCTAMDAEMNAAD